MGLCGAGSQAYWLDPCSRYSASVRPFLCYFMLGFGPGIYPCFLHTVLEVFRKPLIAALCCRGLWVCRALVPTLPSPCQPRLREAPMLSVFYLVLLLYSAFSPFPTPCRTLAQNPTQGGLEKPDAGLWSGVRKEDADHRLLLY